ncbi:MAG TPA: Zn-binding domain-containing protein, partial [Gaiellaceae bacterium]|nr:Zn-binding domain-containing protein [Gaiellaceae bacterium]
AGYTAAQRREIERRLSEGELLGVTSTDALELGIDIGLLDAVISVGFPGTIASLRQQWGRAGRRGHGFAVLVATADALDQYFMREPEKLLGRRVEAAILDHANGRVLAGHVRSAAYEAPIDERDRELLGPEALAAAAADPELKATPRGYIWGGTTTPAARVPLRSADPDSFTVVDASTGSVLGFVERSRAYSTVHEGAVYLHMGETYLVRELGEETLHAVVEPFRGDWYTQPKKETATTILGPLRSERRLGLDLVFGEVEVTDVVVGYERKTIASQERIELVPLVCPPETFATEAIWFSPEPGQLRDLDAMPKLLSTLHAAEHSLIAMLPLWAMCDRWDIGGLSTNSHPDTGRPTIFVYDGHPGGVGITERGFEQFEGWATDTAAMIAACPCADGCPSCVQSPKCGNLNEMLDKAGASLLLDRLAASR